MLKLLSTAGLAVAAVTVALAVAPGAAHAEETSTGGYCQVRDDTGNPKALVAEGELYKDTTSDIYNAYLTAKRTTVSLCKRSQLPDGSTFLQLVELYSYCEGKACRYDLGENPPPLIADAATGRWGSIDAHPEFMKPDYPDEPMVDPIDAF